MIAPAQPATPTLQGTLAGGAAVACWAVVASFMVAAKGVHPVLFMAIENLAGLVMVMSYLRYQGISVRAELSQAPRWFLILGSILFSIQGAASVAAFQFAPPIEALLVHYQWPMLVVIFTALATGKKLPPSSILALGFGLAGLFTLVIGRGLDLASLNYAPGLFWALVSSYTWSFYSTLAARQPKLGLATLAVFFGCGGLLCIGLWALWLDAPMPPTNDRLLIALVGGSISMLGYILWDYGMKRGNTQIIGTASFLIPVLSALVLVLTGQGQFTPLLLVALALVMTGITFARFGFSFLKSKL